MPTALRSRAQSPVRAGQLARARTLALACLLAGAAACSSGEGEPHPPGDAEPAGAARPMRVLPTNASAVDYVFDLAGPERIVAIPSTTAEFCTVPLDPSRWSGERTFDAFSAEVLLALEPDLVVVSPWQDQSTIDRLRESGVAVVELPPVDELADVRTALRAAGAALGEQERAEELVRNFDRRVESLRAAANERGAYRALMYTNYGSGGWAAGSGTTADSMMQLAGVVNAAAEAGRAGHDDISIEELLALDPDLLVISKPSREYGVTRAYLENEAALAELAAIANGRIVELSPGHFSTASHHLLDAAEALATAVDALVASGRLERR